MFSWCALLFLLVWNLSFVSMSWVDGPVDYQISNVKISYFDNIINIGNNLKLMEVPPYLQIHFSFLNKNFKVTLEKKELSDSDTTIEVIGTRNYTINNWKPSLYETTVNEFKMIAMGTYFLNENAFIGFVIENGATYYLEPAKYYFSKYTNNTESYVIIKLLEGIEPLNYPSQNEANKIEEYCRIELVADHTYYNLMNNDESATANKMYLHAKYADLILQHTNLGPHVIRLSPGKYQIYSENNLVVENVDSISSFLEKFSLRAQKYCLSYCFSNRVFPISALRELSYIDSICHYPHSHRRRRHGRENHVNVGVLTSISRDKKQLPLFMTLRFFGHMIGHSFGSINDPKQNFTCSPGGNTGLYLMSSRIGRQDMKILHGYSPCSVAAMTSAIIKYGTCIRKLDNIEKSICGNGVREDKEQCDCGDTEEVCQQIDKCCTPSKATEGGCTFKKGKVCSPIESKCCEADCTITKSRRLCYKDDIQCKSSFCNGMSHECLPPQQSTNGESCMSNSKTCLNGVCNSSVCLDNNLTDCISPDFKFKCFISCIHRTTKKCVPAWELNYHTRENEKFIMLPDTPCDNLPWFRCNAEGQCVDISKHDTNSLSMILVITISSVLLSLCLIGLVVYCLVKPKKHRRPPVIDEEELYKVGNLEEARCTV